MNRIDGSVFTVLVAVLFISSCDSIVNTEHLYQLHYFTNKKSKKGPQGDLTLKFKTSEGIGTGMLTMNCEAGPYGEESIRSYETSFKTIVRKEKKKTNLELQSIDAEPESITKKLPKRSSECYWKVHKADCYIVQVTKELQYYNSLKAQGITNQDHIWLCDSVEIRKYTRDHDSAGIISVSETGITRFGRTDKKYKIMLVPAS